MVVDVLMGFLLFHAATGCHDGGEQGSGRNIVSIVDKDIKEVIFCFYRN